MQRKSRVGQGIAPASTKSALILWLAWWKPSYVLYPLRKARIVLLDFNLPTITTQVLINWGNEIYVRARAWQAACLGDVTILYVVRNAHFNAPARHGLFVHFKICSLGA